jgi:ferric-dicitrate binding protein FerR (iron transport regulator)
MMLLQGNYEHESLQDNVASIVRENQKGQKTRIFLPDGSTVILNSSSKLVYPSGFTNDKREVFLSGEAFFDVTKDSLRPFFVRTEEITARVLGTSFNVRAYPDDMEETIALVTGKVLVSGKRINKDSVLLLPGESAKLMRGTEIITKGTFDFEEEILWKDGILCFKDEPFNDVISQLERWYGVNITIANHPEKDLIVNGRFENEYLDNVLQSMAFTAHFDFQIEGSNINISFSN